MSSHRVRLLISIPLLLALAAGIVLAAAAGEHTKDSVETVKKALAAKKAVLLDVREKEEWDNGHLRDARLLPLSRLKEEKSLADVQELLPKDKAIYLHCAAGRRCLQAAEILRVKGYDLRALKEGYKDLLKLGVPRAGE
jgi:rhodanese-related sulfurtransferase